jgi:thiol-disulfide isomerase/thioredoxin
MNRILLIALFFPAVLLAQQKVTLTGKSNASPDNNQVYIFTKRVARPVVIDSVRINSDHTFSKVLMVNKPGFYYVGLRKEFQDALWLDKENINIDFDSNEAVTLRGGPENEVMDKANHIRNEFITKMSASARPGVNIDRKQLMDSYVAQLTALGRASSNLPSVVYILSFFDFERDAAFIKEISASLLKSNPDNPAVQNYAAEVIRLNPGAPAPDFDYFTLTGERTSLRKVTGNSKYLLVDFWGTYCVPCREGIPGIKNLYAQYHNKGLEVLTVSIDPKADMWKNSVKEEDMPWAQGLAPDTGHAVKETYRFSSIPNLALFDQQGNIVALNLSHEQLEEKFKELMGAPEHTAEIQIDDTGSKKSPEEEAAINRILSKDLVAKYTALFAKETEADFVANTLKLLQQFTLKDFQRSKIGNMLQDIYRNGKATYLLKTNDHAVKQAGYQDFEMRLIGAMRLVLSKQQYEKYLRIREKE